jgi:hypothetical protein
MLKGTELAKDYSALKSRGLFFVDRAEFLH